MRTRRGILNNQFGRKRGREKHCIYTLKNTKKNDLKYSVLLK